MCSSFICDIKCWCSSSFPLPIKFSFLFCPYNRKSDMHSGLFGAEGIQKEPPRGFSKVVEGTTAVLVPPTVEKGARLSRSQGADSKGSEFPTKKDCFEAHGSHDNKEAVSSASGKDDKVDSDDDRNEDEGQAVFYNPAQVVNRDLSVCALACFSRLRREEPRSKGGTRRGITILEALSATGLRAIRYYKEVPDVRYIIANDIDPDAVECIRRNCDFNEVPCARPTLQENFPSSSISVDEETGSVIKGGAIVANMDDANDLMFRLASNPATAGDRRLCILTPGGAEDWSAANRHVAEKRSVSPLLQQEMMDVVDLDPYGSASPFLEGAMRCIKEGGILLVTSTDSAILCGNYPDTCHAKYNTVPMKSSACHEMAVRILLAALERVANKHRKYIVPLLSLHIDFYVRCFVRVYTQAAEVKLSPCKLGYLLQCSCCPAFWVRPMAVSRVRVKKRSRRHNATEKSGTAEVPDDIDNAGTCQTAGAEGSAAKDMESESKVDGLDRECFPPAPSRQGNPKIVAPNLQQMLPPSLCNNRCAICGGSITLSGPIYAAKTQCSVFLTQLLDEIERRGAAGQITAFARISGLVRVALEELPDAPLFYQLPEIASFVRVRCPPAPLFVGALGRMGYRCSQVHCSPAGIKTDSPPDVIVSVMMEWKRRELAKDKSNDVTEDVNERGAETREYDVNVNNPCDSKLCGGGDDTVVGKTGKKARTNLRAPLVKPMAGADFSYEKKFDFRGAVTGVAKFIPNAPNWGPKRRHQGAWHGEESDERLS
uniref:tRNA (guanine(26)-N(2))-dimethyltransferase n=1 Tax=Trypanosoma congolense (strain IL3000) TaxID=1068625 RepID=G0V017_TRYCI|nr:putative N(2), N(2)-dimethylguanosine tRNA methyltransferase [Trypanosoma congolense IL3000]